MKSTLCAILLLVSPAFATIMQQRSNSKWTCSGTVTGGMLQCQQNFTTTGPNDLIAVWTTWQSSVPLTASVSDTLTGIQYPSAVGPIQQPTQASGVPANAQIFYLRSTGLVGGADTVTVTLTGLSGTVVPAFGMAMAEYSGLDTVAPLDSVSEAISNSGSPSGTLDSGTASPANANLLVFGGGDSDNGSATTAVPWTTIQSNGGNITEYQILSGNNALQRATAGLSPSPTTGNWLMQMAIFRGAIWTAAEGLSPIRIHSVRYADQFPGGDCGAKINAADADLASSPGEIWVNNNCGLAWITPVSISSGHVLRFIQGNTSTVYTLSCANPSLGCSTAGITLAANSSMVGPPIAMATNTTPVIELQMATTTPATNLPAIISVNGSFAAIRDIEIDGNSASNGSSGPNIVLNGAQRVDIDHVTSGKSNSDGVKLVGTSSSAKISRLMTYQNKGNGLNCTGQSGDLIVSLSEFEANTGWGAVLFDCAGVRITGSDFGGNTAGGLLDESDGTANGGSNLILEATQFGNNTGDDLLVEGSTSSFGTYQDAIVGNVFIGSSSRSNSGSAIHLVGGGQHIVTGNSIQSANDNKNAYGILMADNSSSAAASVVCDNQFVGSFGTAFYSNSQANASGCASGGGFTNMGAVNILMSPDTPSISPSSGFNTGSISSSASNGTTSFQITIGTGTANNNGTLLFKVAAHGWNCPSLTDITHAAGNLPRQSGVGTTTTVPITNYNNSGTPINWTNNDTIEATCYAY